MNGSGLLVRRRVRRRVLAVAAEWGIQRQRIPRELIDTLEADFDKHLITRVLGLLNPVETTPKKSSPVRQTPRKTDRAASAG